MKKNDVESKKIKKVLFWKWKLFKDNYHNKFDGYITEGPFPYVEDGEYKTLRSIGFESLQKEKYIKKYISDEQELKSLKKDPKHIEKGDPRREEILNQVGIKEFNNKDIDNND